MKIRKVRVEGFKRLVAESGLIVFSVLFALFINRKAEDQKTHQQKQLALERIVQVPPIHRVEYSGFAKLFRKPSVLILQTFSA